MVKKVFTLLLHEILFNGIDDSGFQRKGAARYKHDNEVFYKYLEVIHQANKEVNSDFMNIKNDAIYITFDDGGISNLRAAEILDEFSYKAIFFITTNYINREYFVSENDIRHLRQRGHYLGAHSHTHPNIFRNLSYRRMLLEWKQSKSILENILDEEVLHCSIPGGDSNDKVYESAVESGFKYIFDSEPVLQIRSYGQAVILGRYCPKKNVHPKRIGRWLNEDGLWRIQLERSIMNYLKLLLKPIYTEMVNGKNT